MRWDISKGCSISVLGCFLQRSVSRDMDTTDNTFLVSHKDKQFFFHQIIYSDSCLCITLVVALTNYHKSQCYPFSHSRSYKSQHRAAQTNPF